MSKIRVTLWPFLDPPEISEGGSDLQTALGISSKGDYPSCSLRCIVECKKLSFQVQAGPI